MRINKYLAGCAVASRRSAEDLIRAGKVRVNGEVVTDLATQITDTDRVEVNGRQIRCQPQKVYIILNKPAGVVTTCKDQFNRKSVIDLVQGVDTRVFPVGRLDYATEGILILTNDGGFANKLAHPSSEIPKTYVATIDKKVTPEQLSELCAGAGFYPPKSVRVTQGGVEITICEGKNRQVRKMFKAVGLRVTHLRRILIGGLGLGGLKIGEWRYFSQKDFVCLFGK
jgi:23S rRNA pseudouridine2605 synthase